MTDMLKRATAAVLPIINSDQAHIVAAKSARAALFAALNIEDAVELQQIAIYADEERAKARAARDVKDLWFSIDETRVWLAALKRHAHGGSDT